MADDDDVPALGDRIDHGASVRPPAGRLLLARKINCYGFVPALAQLGTTRCQSHALLRHRGLARTSP